MYFTSAALTHLALGVNYWDASFVEMMDELKVYGEAVGAEGIAELYEGELLGDAE